MILIRSLIFDLLMFALIPILGILFAPLAIWSRGGAYWTCKLYCHIVFWLLKVLCGIRVEIRGEVPQDEVLICSKHQSFLDVMMHMHALPRVRYVMKKELKWAPVIGLYGMRIGSTPVSRRGKGGSVKKMMSDVAKSADDFGQLCIYPQGTRTLPGQDLPYKIGAGVIYQRMGIACVPAATNVGVLWGRRSRLRKPGLAVLEYLEPIPPGQELDAFMKTLEHRVETASDALMAEIGFNKA